MKKLYTAVFLVFIGFSSAAFAGSFNSTYGPDDKVLNKKDTTAGMKMEYAANDAKEGSQTACIPQNNAISTDNLSTPAGSKSDDIRPKTKTNREQAFIELCEFLCGLRTCVGECTDMNCIMQQMYFYTR